jgi:predicted DNA-binding transcriptional regulator AlpA
VQDIRFPENLDVNQPSSSDRTSAASPESRRTSTKITPIEELWNSLYQADDLLVRLPYQHQQNQQLPSMPVPSTEPAVPQKNGLLDVCEAARVLGMSRKWLYRNWRSLPHVLIPAGRKPRIRFRRVDLERWIHTHSFNLAA